MIYLLSDQAHEGVEHLPLFEIRFDTTPIDLAPYDALVFTSKNAVKALDCIDPSWKQKASYAIGEGTAAWIERLGGTLYFTCEDSYGDRFAEKIASDLTGKTVLFPRAKEVSSSLYVILRERGVWVDERIVYEMFCRSYEVHCAPPKNARLIFTSPSTVRCFFKNFEWDESYKAVAIGTKTAAAFPPSFHVYIAQKPSIASCIDLAKAI